MIENYFTLDKIESLIKSRVPESLYLEYKSELNLINDREKKEFLYDVSAFANSYGGNIIFGILSKDGFPVELVGINCNNIDNLIQTIEQLLNNCIQPKIYAYKIYSIEIEISKYLLIINLPHSWISPHMVIHSKDTKFYLRDNSGKHPMNIDEIRFAFKFSDSLVERTRNFHLERINKINSHQIQFRLPIKPFLIAHWIPINSFQSMDNINLEFKHIPQLFGRPANIVRYNIDGITAYDQGNDGSTYFYTQIFRNGIIESTEFEIIHKNNVKFELKYYTVELFRHLKIFIDFLKSYNFNIPILLLISIVNVKNIEIEYPKSRHYLNFFDRDIIQFQEVLIDNYDLDNYDLKIKPLLDSLWNAGGFAECYMYENDKFIINKEI